jgi:probable rRNA maturation factor
VDAFPDFQEDGGEPELVVAVEHSTRSLDVDRLEARLRTAMVGEGFELRYLAVVLTDRATVQTLHRDFFADDTPTDVVTFPLDEAAAAARVIDGEVYVDLDTAAERAPEFETDLATEATRYALHGLIHLMGHDDATEEQRATMRTLEDRYLHDQAE